jgi:integrase
MRRIPAPQIDPPDPERMPVAEAWQYDALMSACRRRASKLDRRDAAIIAVLWWTGMRRSEIANLDFERIDFDLERVYLPRTKGGRRAPKSRWVTLPDEAMEAVDLWIDHRGRSDGPLFTSQRGGRLDADSINLMLRRRGDQAAKLLHVDDPVYMPAHGYRRSSAIEWLDNGGSESTLMTNHGWRTRKMIDIYTGAKATELAAADARKVAAARRSGRLRSVG